MAPVRTLAWATALAVSALTAVVPMSRERFMVAMRGALGNALPDDAVDALDDAIAAGRAPSDYIPPGVREQVYIIWQGVNRSYTLYTPTTYNSNLPTPLLFSIHSAGTSPFISATWTALDWVAEENAFVTVYPKGIDRTFYAGPKCCGSNSTRDDVGFMRAIRDDIIRRRNVDVRRVYSTGQSNGGYMSHRLACDASDWIAAIAPVSSDSPWVDFDANCHPVRQVPVISFHGTRDAAVSYEGGYETFAWWRQHNGCTADMAISFTGGVTTCESWTNCALNSDGTRINMTFCSAEGVGHIYWPGSWLPGINKDIDGSREIWKYLSQYSL